LRESTSFVRWAAPAIALAGLLVMPAPRAHAQDADTPRAIPGVLAPTSTDMGSLLMQEPLALLGERRRADGPVQASTEDEAIARWNIGGSSRPEYPSNRAGFHVAPRVMVDTVVRGGHLPARSAAKGTLSQLAVLAQSRNRGYWPFRICYEEGLRRDPALRGKVEARFTVGRSGKVTGSRLLNSSFKDREVARCVATRTQALTFSPAPSRRIDVDVTVELNPGDAPLPSVRLREEPAPGVPATVRTPPAREPSPAVLREALKESSAALEARTPDLVGCYTSGLLRDPGLWGRIGLRIRVAEDGTASAVAQHESRFPDSSVVSCVAAVVKSVPFCKTLAHPVELEWGARLGAPSLPGATSPAGAAEKSVVADTTGARLPLGN
jgi:hypothetical protein